MKNTHIIDFISVEDIKNNISDYFNQFKDNAVICFRNANLSKAEQVEVLTIFGDYSGWFPNTELLNDPINIDGFVNNAFYIEDHSRSYDPKNGNDDFAIVWHLEHFYRANRTVAAAWNMTNFKCSPESGKTYFVDMCEIWNSLSKSEQTFLQKCKSYTYYLNDVHESDVISKHWLYKNPLVQLDFNIDDNKQYLSKYEGRDPEQHEIDVFNIIMFKLMKRITQDTTYRIVHKWKEGDLLIPDLNKLAHTITGGFKPEERSFIGIWATQYPYSK